MSSIRHVVKFSFLRLRLTTFISGYTGTASRLPVGQVLCECGSKIHKMHIYKEGISSIILRMRSAHSLVVNAKAEAGSRSVRHAVAVTETWECKEIKVTAIISLLHTLAVVSLIKAEEKLILFVFPMVNV